MESKSNNNQNPRNIQGRTKGRIENLKPQKAGEPSHNPNGRPKGVRNRSTIVREWLEAMESVKNPITGLNEKLSQYDIITLALIKKARNGDVQAFKELMDSSFGKIPDKVLSESINVIETQLNPEEARKMIAKLKMEIDTNNG